MWGIEDATIRRPDLEGLMNLRDHDQKCEHGLAIAHTTNEGHYCFGGAEVKTPMEGLNPFKTLITLEMAKMIDDAVTAEMSEWAPNEQFIKERVTAEVTRQLQPAIIAAMTRITWQLNAEEPF